MDWERIRGIAGRVAATEGLELVAVEWAGSNRQGVLRVFIDRRDGGVTHGDCQTVSQQVGAILDAEDLIPCRYTLEVASPGLDRKLYSPDDFARFAGRRVRVRLKAPRPELGGRRFQARLAGLEAGVVSFQLDAEVLRVPYDDLAAVNLVAEL